MKTSIDRLIAFFANTFWIVLSVFVLTQADLETVCAVTLAQLLFTVILYRYLRIPILSYEYILTLTLMLFHFGQTWLYALGVNPTDLQGYANVIKRFNSETIRTAVFYSSLLVDVIVTITICTFHRENGSPRYAEVRIVRRRMYTANRIGKLVWVIYWAIVILGNLYRAAHVQEVGYGKGFMYTSSLMYTLSTYALPVTVFTMWRNRSDLKKKRNAVVPLVISELITIILVGNRGASVIRLIVVAVYYMRLSSVRISGKKRLCLAFCAVLVLLLMPFISATRTGVRDVGFIRFLIQENPIVIFLSEFGSTLMTACYSVHSFRPETASGGMQLLACVMSIIPGIGAIYPQIGTDIAFAQKLNQLFDIRGLGGSMAGELYYNFGFAVWGFVVIALIYLITLKLQDLYRKKDHTIYRDILTYQIFYGMLGWVRGSAYDLFAAMKIGIYFVVGLFLLSYFVRLDAKTGKIRKVR